MLDVFVATVAALMTGLAVYLYPTERGFAAGAAGVAVFLGLLLVSGLDDGKTG